MTALRPFFCYYGGKWRSAPRYPAPRHGVIVEPFAGAAGYATRHHGRRVVLLDTDPVIAGLWQYLIDVRASEIRSIPTKVEHVNDLNVAQEAKWLVGFWLNKGASVPCKQPSAWMRGGTRPSSYWGECVRDRIAVQVEKIRHWEVLHEPYWRLPPHRDITWFVDPPYEGAAGRHYRHGNSIIDFPALGDWCRSREGQTIVCENVGAAWLPFRALHVARGTPGRTRTGRTAEVIWTSDDRSAAMEAA